MILSNLEKATMYSIQVATVSTSGLGMQSKVVKCNTAEDLPNAPRDLKALSISHETILITWLPPLNTNGQITQYKIYVKDVKLSREKSFSVEATKNSFPVHGLVGGRYDFWVTASTLVGEGPASHIVTQSTKASPPVKIATLNQNFVVVEGGTVSLPCQVISGARQFSTRWQHISTTVLQMPLSDQPDVEHRITNVTREDDGEWTCLVSPDAEDLNEDSIAHRLTVVWPLRPPILSHISSSASSIILKLDQPSSSFPTLTPATTYHTIEYKEPNGESKTKELDAGISEVVLDSLQCGTLYHITASSHSPHESGKSSPILTARTIGGPPSGPQSDVLSNHFLEPYSTSVILHMGAWQDGGCPLIDVNVEVKLWEAVEWEKREPTMVLPIGDLVVEGLAPGRWHNLKVIVNDESCW